MKPLAFVAVLFLVVGAAACTQPKPSLPTPTLITLNQTPVLPLSATDTPAVSDTPAVAVETSAAPTEPPPPPSAPTVLVTPTTEAQAPTTAPTSAPPPPPAATAVPSGGGGCPNPYTVRAGDWLYQIARNCGVTPQALIAANPGINPNILIAGTKLRIPGGGGGGGGGGGSGRTYVVRPGDDLFSIAVRFGTTVAVLMQLNGLDNPNYVYAGQVLKLP